MGYGVGQTTGQTGVGTTANTTGQTQQAGYGGKGGGQATQPQQTPLAQPSQSSTAQAAPSPVFGGNAFGYNIGRLSQRMDPSATLPQAPQASTAPAQTQSAPTGGKGGGYGVTVDELNDLGAFISGIQPAQQPAQQPYGVTGAQTYNPYDYYNMQGVQTQPTPQLENPFAGQMQQYQQQMQEMQNMYQQQLNALRQQMSQMQDTGAQTYELGPGYEELTNATTTAEQEQIASEKEKTQEEQEAVEATRPEWQTDKGYEYKTYANFKPEDLVGMSAKEIKALYGQQATQAKTDVTKAQADYNAALKTGNPKLIAGARDNLNAQKAELAKITADQKAASKFLTGAGKTYEAADVRTAREKAAADAKAKAVADATAKKAAEAAAKKAAADKKKAEAAAKKAKAAPAAKTKPAPAVKIGQSAGTSAVKSAPVKASKKKAHGGVIHDGMSKRLKHMLGEK